MDVVDKGHCWRPNLMHSYDLYRNLQRRYFNVLPEQLLHCLQIRLCNCDNNDDDDDDDDDYYYYYYYLFFIIIISRSYYTQ